MTQVVTEPNSRSVYVGKVDMKESSLDDGVVAAESCEEEKLWLREKQTKRKPSRGK